MRLKARPLTLAPLRWAIRAGIALVLLTPLVVSGSTVFPFVVGKALYSRTVIEIVFGLWTIALLASGFRRTAGKDHRGLVGLRWRGTLSEPSLLPPRSWILVLCAVGLVCYAVAAWLGVSWPRSLWSTHERMQGFVDAAHWFAFILVVAATFHSAKSWRGVLNVNLGISILVCLLAIASQLGLELPLYGRLPERDPPRIGTVLGNATYLGTYAMLNFVVALGLLASSFMPADDGQQPPVRRIAAIVFWLAGAALNLYALSLSGSYGPFAALILCAVPSMAACVYIAKTRLIKWLAAVAAGVLVAGLATMATVFVMGPPADSPEHETANPLLLRLSQSSVDDRSSKTRLLAWEAGWEGFAERPFAGWGPDNYIVVFGAFADGLGASTELHDYAHNKLVEEAATKGLLGLVSYLALWLFVFFTVLRAVRRLGRREQTLAVFIGAALLGYCVQMQTLFDAAALNMQCMLLLGFVVYLETSARNKPAHTRQANRRGSAVFSALATAACVACRRLGVAIGLAGLALAVAGAGLVANRATYAASTALLEFESIPSRDNMARAIGAFPPLAIYPRLVLFEYVRRNWRQLRVGARGRISDLLAWVEREAAQAVATEPHNWFLHNQLARMYRELATTEPSYAAAAERHEARSFELAPDQITFVPTNIRLREEER